MSTKIDWTSHIDIDPDRVYGFNFNAFNSVYPNPHPWTTSLEALAEWLENDWELPHGSLQFFPFTGDGIDEWFDETPQVFFISECDDCKKLFALRFRYKQERSQ